MAEKPQVKSEPASAMKLPPPRLDSNTSIESALYQRRSVREFDKKPLALTEISQLHWAAQGLSGSEGKRTAPSAGALYPLEIFVVAGKDGELPAGVYRYRPDGHDLLLTAPGDKRAKLARAALDQDWLAEAPLTLVVAAIYERTARKYRQRADRYVQMEVGHAAQNVHLQAIALGLATVVVGAFEDGEVKRVLPLAANEQPLCLMPIGSPHR